MCSTTAWSFFLRSRGALAAVHSVNIKRLGATKNQATLTQRMHIARSLLLALPCFLLPPIALDFADRLEAHALVEVLPNCFAIRVHKN